MKFDAKLFVGEGETKTHYALTYSPNGSIELFKFVKNKLGQYTIDGVVGSYNWFKTYINWDHCAKGLLALEVSKDVYDNIGDLITAVEQAKTAIIEAMTAFDD